MIGFRPKVKAEKKMKKPVKKVTFTDSDGNTVSTKKGKGAMIDRKNPNKKK
jgi:hypothetical protein